MRGRTGGRVLIAGVAVLLLLGGLLAIRARDEPGASAGTGATPATTAAPTTAGSAGVAEGTCEPTPGEAAQGTTREVAADAPSTARLGPGGDVERTAETVAAGWRDGTRLTVSGTVYGPDCETPLAGASIQVWQTNAAGEYGPGQGTGDERCCYLGAGLRTDARGRYRFETVRPGHYKGEAQPPPAHIHFEVRHPDADGLLTELLFEGDPHLGPDPPGVVVRLTPAPGAGQGALQARFDILMAG
jgi:protocatechuate 3,4-dioxygenase beta subunit